MVISKYSRTEWKWLKSVENGFCCIVNDGRESREDGCCLDEDSKEDDSWFNEDDGRITWWDDTALDFDRVTTAPSNWTKEDLSFVNPNPYSESNNSSSYEIGCRES